MTLSKVTVRLLPTVHDPPDSVSNTQTFMTFLSILSPSFVAALEHSREILVSLRTRLRLVPDAEVRNSRLFLVKNY